MKVLIIGSGAREHALGWKIKSESPQSRLVFVPGNGGTLDLGVNIGLNGSAPSPSEAARKAKPDFIIVGPEVPLAQGLVDELDSAGFSIFGVSRRAAQLEASKIFAKTFMQRSKIPTAKFKIFDDAQAAKNYAAAATPPLVIKADGLAQGKGVVVAKTRPDALIAIDDFMVKKTLGVAGEKILIEEFLEGTEVSLLAFFDGQSFVYLPPCRDYKKLNDGDSGPNTGGMGSICPVIHPKTFWETFENEIAKPFKECLEKEGVEFRGLIYFGLMLTSKGLRVLEFNVRFGDPETQALVAACDLPMLEFMQATRETMLKKFPKFIFLDRLDQNPKASVCVVLASPGYPAKPATGHAIDLPAPKKGSNVLVFHAGTKNEQGALKTSGGRVMSVVGCGKTQQEAARKAYQWVEKIHFEGMHYRKDIGK